MYSKSNAESTFLSSKSEMTKSYTKVDFLHITCTPGGEALGPFQVKMDGVTIDHHTPRLLVDR